LVDLRLVFAGCFSYCSVLRNLADILKR
jgi:hypothetical protein